MPHALVIAARNRAPGSAVIRLAQGWRAWSHTADVLTGEPGVTVEALALRGGVVRSTVADLTQHRSSAYITLARELPADALAARDAWLLAQVGRGYDWTGAVGAAWGQMRQWDDPARWWCSEQTCMASSVADALTISPYIRGVMPTQAVDLHLAAGWHVVT